MIVCIGREFGSGGHEIGMLLSDILGCEFYDHALVDEAAKALGDPGAEVVGKADERRANLWIKPTYVDNVDTDMRGLSINDVTFQLQSRMIIEKAQKGNCIFVGHCADFILNETGIDHISVFISSPVPERIKRKMEQTGKGEREVAAMIRRKDRQRANYYNYYTQGNWGHPSTYDLCVNSSRNGVKKTAELLGSIIKQYET